jgi:hypothetical protein
MGTPGRRQVAWQVSRNDSERSTSKSTVRGVVPYAASVSTFRPGDNRRSLTRAVGDSLADLRDPRMLLTRRQAPLQANFEWARV